MRQFPWSWLQRRQPVPPLQRKLLRWTAHYSLAPWQWGLQAAGELLVPSRPRQWERHALLAIASVVCSAVGQGLSPPP